MAKQGLTKSGFKDQIGLKLERTRREERRGEEEEEEEKMEEPRSRPKRYGTLIFGMETHLDHEFYVIMYEFPCYWMVVSYP